MSVILEPYEINRHFVGFDAFEGFASIDNDHDPGDVSSESFYDGCYETIKKALEAIDHVRPVNNLTRFVLVKGDVTETFPKYLKENPAFT